MASAQDSQRFGELAASVMSYGAGAGSATVTLPSALLIPQAAPSGGVGGSWLAIVMCALVCLGSVNFLLLKVLFSAYGEEYSFFVSQGINVLYVLYGGLLVYPRMIRYNGWGDSIAQVMSLGKITPSMVRAPQQHFAAIGMLDCFGTFFTAMGAVYTPGQFQPLLNQSLIPAIMLLSALVLRVKYSWNQVGGAALIVIGAVISLSPSLQAAASGGSNIRVYAVCIYWMSNVPMACSAVYKECRFKEDNLDTLFFTQWVSLYQLVLGFLLAPLQVIPGVGSENGKSLHDIYDSFFEGSRCFMQYPGTGCEEKMTFWLLLAYVCVNFCFNTLGLYLTKRGGAVLNAATFALLLPLTTIIFSFPFMGRYQEALHLSTFAGLVVVLFGFSLYRYAEINGEIKIPSAASTPQTRRGLAPISFQERGIGFVA